MGAEAVRVGECGAFCTVGVGLKGGGRWGKRKEC